SGVLPKPFSAVVDLPCNAELFASISAATPATNWLLRGTAMATSVSTLTPGGTALIWASKPAAADTLGGMQNLRASKNHRLKTSTTSGRKMLSTNIATIVMSGMEKKQIWMPASFEPPPFRASGPGFIAWEWMTLTGENFPSGAWDTWAASSA